MENRANQRTPQDDDFDPKHFVKKVETELVFDSDGELDTLRDGNKNTELSSIMKQEESGNQEEQTDPNGNTLFEGSFQQQDQFFHKENRINFQYQDLSLKKPDQAVAERKFSGIYEDEYFMFVEDYDKFIGEFVSDEKVKIVRGFLNNNEYDRIYYTRIVPNEKTFANLLMVHGFGHSAKYLEFGNSMARQGFAVHLFDIRGFGFSGGQRYNPLFDQIYSDMIMIIKGLSTKLPLFLYGHGSGATIVLSFLLKHDITVAGCILSAPMLQLEAIENTSYGSLKIVILSLVGEFFKDFVVNNLENPTALTRNSFHIKKHLDDRISVPFIGIRFLRELILAFRAIRADLAKLAVPVCVLQGLKDTICDPTLTKELFQLIPTDAKRLVLYPQGFHEMFNDIGGDKYKKDVLLFMTDVLKKDCPNLGILKKQLLLNPKADARKMSKKRYIVLTIFGLLYLQGIFLY